MRGFRLNGWQRIGIMLSIVWAMAAWFYARHVDLALHSNVLSLEYHRCADLPSEKERADCQHEPDTTLKARSKRTGSTLRQWPLSPSLSRG